MSTQWRNISLCTKCMAREHTCRALRVCLQGECKGLVGLKSEGGHAPAHDWQVATPCNVLHADLARSLHGLPAHSCACMREDLVTPRQCNSGTLLGPHS